MIPLLVHAPEPELAAEKSTTETHLFCCDPDTALCGLTLTGDIGEEDDPVDCFACVAVDEASVPCRAKFCRLRSWWRDRRSS